MDFGRQSSSEAPQSLILTLFSGHRLLVSADKMVSRTRYSFLRSLMRTSRTRSHVPFLAQRSKRVWTLFHLPYRADRSCQFALECSTHSTLSAADRPASPFLPGSRLSMRRHWASVSSYRLTTPHAPNQRSETQGIIAKADENPECRLDLAA